MTKRVNSLYNLSPEDLKKREIDLKEAQRANQGKFESLSLQGKMDASTQKGKVMRLNEAKKQIAGKTATSQNMGNKIALAAQGVQMAGNMAGVDSTSAGGGAIDGAAQGAAMGATFGPKGALIGAGVGALKGIMGAKSARKARRRKAQAEMHENIGKIEGQKTDRLMQAFQSMQQAFGQTLL